MRSLIAGVAAIALATTAAYANPGKGNGKNNGNGKPAAAANQGGGPKADRGNRGPKRAERGPDRRVERRADRRQERRVDRREDRREARFETRANRNPNRGNDRDVRVVDRGDRFGLTPVRDARGLVQGCPPGLAKKNNGCQPPGQAKKRGYYRPDYFGFSRYRDGRYFYDDGFLLRLDGGNRVSGYIPLLGGALAIGNTWPDYYRATPVPDYYSSFYNLGEPRSYRYADDVIYRVDPETAAITSIAALLTGDEFVVGRPMPRGYDVYNVPYAYRDQYYDRPDAMYRYSDGYVYKVDPETMLIASAIELLI